MIYAKHLFRSVSLSFIKCENERIEQKEETTREKIVLIIKFLSPLSHRLRSTLTHSFHPNDN